jgi:hypothetical protein
MMTEDGYKAIASFFQHNDVSYVDGEFLFKFLITDEALKRIDDLTKKGVEVDRFDGDQSYERHDLEQLIGKELTACISRQKITDSGFNIYLDWDDYLSYKKNQLEPKSSFLILEDGNLYPFDKDRASRLKNYLKITKFIRFLDELSELDSLSPGSHKLKVSFVHKVRIDVLIEYTANDLDNDLDGFESLERIFSSVEHKTQRNSLMRETLYLFLYAKKNKERFGCLISKMSEFSTEFMENYSLFVSEFSLEKIRKEYEESKREYFSKINEVIFGIHTRMLGIPAVLVLAAFRFSDKAVAGQVVGNLIIFAAVIVYALMMHYLIKSQKDTLFAIKNEAAEHIARFSSKNNPDEIKSISKASSDVKEKCDVEIRRLGIFYWMIGALALVMFGLLLYSFGVFSFFSELQENNISTGTIFQLSFSKYI